MNLKNKRILVVGLGKSGFAAARLAKASGAEVFVTEKNLDEGIERLEVDLKGQGIEVETNGHSQRFLRNIDIVVISPGISVGEPFVKEKILSSGIPVVSEIEFAFGLCRSNKIIAVTGTNGKSTTVELIAHVLREAGKDVVVCGNIGTPFADCIKEISKETIVVLEVSSYQLETIKKFKPSVSVILNITDDHLDRYGSLRDYALAKMRIFENQTESDLCILNLDDDETRRLAPYSNARVQFFSLRNKNANCFVDGEKIVIKKDKSQISVCDLRGLPFCGNHNIENTMASILAVSFFMEDCNSLWRAISTFSPLDHRTQLAGTICGVDFIDDSKGTNVDATRRAIEALDKNIILICGGRNKKSDFSKVLEVAYKKVKLAVAIGECREEIATVFKAVIKTEFADSMSLAVRLAFERAKEGECVLLSPMCASFDMFKDYKDRGDCFKKAVLELEREVRCARKE